jgi:hypothetical protein
VIDPGSKLAIARGLRTQTATSSLGAVLGVSGCDEDDLYAAMDWMFQRRETLENALAARHLANGTLVLYDVSSAALLCSPTWPPSAPTPFNPPKTCRHSPRSPAPPHCNAKPSNSSTSPTAWVTRSQYTTIKAQVSPYTSPHQGELRTKRTQKTGSAIPQLKSRAYAEEISVSGVKRHALILVVVVAILLRPLLRLVA